ncbi:hypothetical protein G7Y89_g13864 [Cudoniella acicularis]|uniref:3'-5' exoribonuclease Rv2179c-like domain-containing protein n=1 Tax=Cudoniella acicularis TaxID=354080 RepID=A0A8H4R8Q0_9HELO|nr:hypothetical protein G7Y89_g13864 [Cudoniella acicularis]
MRQKNYHTNIMLDLEIAGVDSDNPVIIALAAVYFDPDTGKELAHILTPVSYDSCLKLGLVTDEKTLTWLDETIPETLNTSKSSTVSLEKALFKFSNFVRTSCRKTIEELRKDGRENLERYSQPMIWGNGAIADNVWIRSAYRACGMERPWKFWNDMCVRTVVKQCAALTGRDYSREIKFQGEKHNPLDDCRHQVRYLVLAMDTLSPPEQPQPQQQPRRGRRMVPPTSAAIGGRTVPVGLITPETSFSELENLPQEFKEFQSRNLLPSPSTGRGLPSPEISFSSKDVENPELSNIRGTSASRLKRQRVETAIPRLPLSPETSFVSAEGDKEIPVPEMDFPSSPTEVAAQA